MLAIFHDPLISDNRNFRAKNENSRRCIDGRVAKLEYVRARIIRKRGENEGGVRGGRYC